MLTYYIATLSLIPYFTSRTFIPLFTTAVFARFGPQWTWAAELAGVELLGSIPAWATSNYSLFMLGVFAAIELIATKNPEFREIVTSTFVDAKLKAVGAFFMSFVMVEGNFSDIWRHFEQNGPGTDFAWGQSFAYAWSFAIGVAVWLTGLLRSGIYAVLIELDEDDDLGLQGLLSWLEDIFSFVGVLFVIILPTVALAVAGFTLLALYLVRRYLEYRDAKKKVPCENCGTPGYPCGLRCGSCGQLRRFVHQVGWLGGIKDALVTDLDGHRMTLLARKRCPSCGDRYKERRVDQRCRGCGAEPFGSAGALEIYLAKLRAGLLHTLAILLVLSFIPVLGLIPGIIYYRLSLISSLRCYLPRSVGFVTRWFVRIVNLVLIALQPVPFLGALTLPLMCLTNYVVYQWALRRQGRRALRAEPLPA